ncbi:MAG: helix-turn-helix domain-containing protein [bacterium]|nr:helix-turn-helix domain-containing protein [bacterium]
MPAPDRSQKLTRTEVAKRLRVHAHTVDRWTEAGLLRPMRFPSPSGGRPTIRYSIAEVERFERESESH